MSKITQEKKESKLKGKQAKIAKSKTAKKELTGAESTEAKTSGKCMNYGKCCTCTHYPYHKNGEAQPCKKTGTYVARKCATCPVNAYKCKWQ